MFVVPKKYIPKYLSKSNAQVLKKEIQKSRKAYKKGKYYIRKPVKTMKVQESIHVKNAKQKCKFRNNLRKSQKKLAGMISKSSAF